MSQSFDFNNPLPELQSAKRLIDEGALMTLIKQLTEAISKAELNSI